jgi:hypothetical protein
VNSSLETGALGFCLYLKKNSYKERVSWTLPSSYYSSFYPESEDAKIGSSGFRV